MSGKGVNMNRLTEINENGNINIINPNDADGAYDIKELDRCDDAELLDNIAFRLSQFEIALDTAKEKFANYKKADTHIYDSMIIGMEAIINLFN